MSKCGTENRGRYIYAVGCRTNIRWTVEGSRLDKQILNRGQKYTTK